MGSRGRGRGRGGFSYGRIAKEEKYEVFPEITELPAVNFKQKQEEYTTLVSRANDLKKFWQISPYYLVDTSQGDKNDESIKRKPPLSDYMLLSSDYVPGELVGKNVRHSRKKTRWNLQSDLQKLDLYLSEKLDQDRVQDKEKKEDEEEEDEDIENIEEEEDDSDDDYAQNRDFDDDEDDFNMNDDHDGDEGCY